MNSERSWLDAAPDAMLLVDATGTIVFASQRSENLLGWTPAELIGRAIEFLVPPQHTAHPAIRERYAEAPSVRHMGGGRELEARHKSGEDIPVEIALSPLMLSGAPHVIAAVRDVRSQRALLHRLQVHSIALDAAASGVVITTCDGIITWVNPAVCLMTGYSSEELVGHRPSVLKSGHHEPAFYAELWATVTAGKTWRGAIINRSKSGALYHEEQTISPVLDAHGAITHYIAIKQDVTVRVRAEQALARARDELVHRVAEVEALQVQLREQAIRDALTGLFNRRYLDETLPRELANAKRNGSEVALAMLDVDHFKRVNDAHGHATGDLILAALGEILLGSSRSGDVACRYGGEEFAVVLVGASLANALRRAETWREAFKGTVVAGPNGAVGATCSVGVAAWAPHESVAGLLARADAALYEAKHQGRDRAVAAPEASRPQD